MNVIEIYRCVPYGDWFVGFSEIFSSLAFARTASSVRPSLSPMTRVGVFCFASWRSSDMSADVQGVPVFLVDFDIKTPFVLPKPAKSNRCIAVPSQ